MKWFEKRSSSKVCNCSAKATFIDPSIKDDGVPIQAIRQMMSFLLRSHLQSWLIYILEPIGSAKPKFSTTDKTSSFDYASGTSIAFLCPAQGAPLPSFR